MDSPKLDPVSEVVTLVRARKNFVLQGGAGSGKTESLKRVVQKLKSDDPTLKIACITHTNKAADEIADRVESDITVSTIHSFLASLIGPFGKNIQCVFPDLFLLPCFRPLDQDESSDDEKERKKQEHDRFKKAHGKLTERRRVVLVQATDKVTGKREYDKDPDHYNADLNRMIDEVNLSIRAQMKGEKYKDFKYNETSFDSFKDSSFGHDGLLSVACRLLDMYPTLGKIIADRYDCIFIDEYQDTNEEVIRVLLHSPPSGRMVVGLFGDSEQAIYKEGIGSAQAHIEAGELILVEKEDNFRCSPQVIEFANKFRTDDLTQEIAFKTLSDGSLETIEDREGEVRLYYSIAPEIINVDNVANDTKPHNVICSEILDALVTHISKENDDYVQLKLTNKSIANDVGFGNLYRIFSDRYRDPRERMKRTLDRLQFAEIIELVRLFKSLPGDRRAYNRMISKLRKRGFSIRSVQDKETLEGLLASLSDYKGSAYETVQFAIKSKLIRISESHETYLKRRDSTLDRLAKDVAFQEFEGLNAKGLNTKTRMLKSFGKEPLKQLNGEIIEEKYEEMEKDLKEKRFLSELFSSDLKFADVLMFYEYEYEDGKFATMHKTKGTGIENVLVILDEYGWGREYDFLSCFSGEPPASSKEISTRKLLYVACSRAKKNLICVRLAQDEAEASRIADFFPNAEEVPINLLSYEGREIDADAA